MKNKNMKKQIMMIVSLAVLAMGVACSPAGAIVETQAVEVQAAPLGETAVSDAAVVEAVTAAEEPASVEMQVVANGMLTESEVEGLLFMREEEKLAGDVYRYFYDMYGNAIFQNIASSEDAHTNAVLNLLSQYGIADPAAAEAGVFSNPDLQSLYDQLIALGSQSLKDALLVGAAIEEIDILDLEERIAQTDEADIKLVYENLTQGSESHLRAFVRVIGNQAGESYTPQYLSQESYDEIMQGENGAGASGNAQPSKGGGRRWDS